MTVVVGFRCLDGVVIAADREISLKDWHKYHEEKLLVIETAHAKLVLGYSGLPPLAKQVVERLGEKLDNLDDPFSSEEPSYLAMRQCVEATIVELAQQNFNQFELKLLITFSFRNYCPDLWTFNDAGFHTVEKFAVIGIGDSSLIRYLEQMHYEGDTIELGERLAVFLIEKAKKHVEGCGGQTDVISMKSGLATWRIKPHAEIAEVEKEIAKKESTLLRKIISP